MKSHIHGPSPGCGGTDSVMLSNLLPGHSVASVPFNSCVIALGNPEQEDDGQSQDD